MLKKQPLYIFPLFLLLLGVFISQYILANDTIIAVPKAEKGVIDLRHTDLFKTPVVLKGEWIIYWQNLVTPLDTQIKPAGFVEFPKLWNNTILNGQQLPAKGFATYELTVLLSSDQHKKLAIEIPDTYCSYKLYLNGSLLASAGNPGTTKETTTNKWLEKTEVLPDADTLHLLLQVANFQHAKGGPYKNMIIGEKEALFFSRETETGFDLILMGCLFMGGLFFFGLFLFGKHDKVIFFFSLFCITYSYRIIGSKTYVLHTLFPEMPWWLGVHLEYLSLFVSVILFLFYTKHLYPKETNKIIFDTEVIAGSIISLIVIFFPPHIFTQLINPFLLIMFCVVAHAFIIYVKAYINKRLGAKYALWSTAVLLVIIVLINLQYFGAVEPPKYILFIGYTTFFFLQSLILSFRFAYILNEAKKQAELGLIAKNDFLSTMSHEIRTPLNSILGMTHLMLRDTPAEEQKEQLNVLLFSANNLLSIVNDILDYNKIEAGKVSFESIEMDIRYIAQNIISGSKNAATEKNIALNLFIDAALQNNVLGDPTRTSQIFGNLLHNAIKFTRKGSVKLQIKVVSQTEQNIRLLVEIIDTGIGIAQEKQKIIFEQFTQADTTTSRNFGGTGLGLAICKRLLDLQGSNLELKSEPNKGSTFFFTIDYPIVHQKKIPAPVVVNNMPTEESKPLTNISILLVEDNEVNILVARTFLQKWGAIIDVAQNGQEALDKLDVNKHRLVLMDMHMPIMDGYEATRQIRAKGITLPIIALTASLPKEVVERVRDTGINDIVVKPFVPKELFRVILHYTGIHHSL